MDDESPSFSWNLPAGSGRHDSEVNHRSPWQRYKSTGDGKKTVAHLLTPHMATKMHPCCLSALREGKLDHLYEMLQDDPTLIYGVTVKGNSILHIAASLGNFWPINHACNNTELDNLLLHRNLKGDTILHCAARAGHDHIISLMIDHQAGKQMVGVLNQRGDSALHEAARCGHVKVVRQLLPVGENMASIVNEDRESPLYLAAVRGSVETVKMLLGCAVVDYRGPRGQTALHAAVCGSYGPYHYFNNPFNGDEAMKAVMDYYYYRRERHHRLVKKLSERMMDYYYRRPRVQSVQRSYDIVNMLLEKMPGLNLQADASQSTPIHYAASLGDVEMVGLLIQADTTVAHLLDDQSLSAIHIAASKDYTEVIEKILQHCPDATELTDGDGNNFFHVAAKKGATTVVKLVLNNLLLRQSINETNHEGNTPLHMAVMNHNIEIVQLLLLDSRVDKNVINCMGLTSLDAALSIDASKFGFSKMMMIKALNSAGTKFDPRRMDIIMYEDQAGCPEEELDRHRTIVNNLGIVAILIATVTFAAAFTLPGGYNSDDSNQGQGMAILAKKVSFKVFLISDTIAMASSTIAIFMLIYSSSPDYSRSSERNLRISVIIHAMRYVKLALGGMLVAFSLGIYAVVNSQCRWLAILICVMTIIVPIFVWMFIDIIWAHWLKLKKNLGRTRIFGLLKY